MDSLRVISSVLVGLFSSFIMAGCHPTGGAMPSTKDIMIDSLVPVASHSFRIEYYQHYKVIKVLVPGKEQPVNYVVCAPDVKLPLWLNEAVRIDAPVTRVACLSTTHIGAMQLLNARDRIVVAANTDLICDSGIATMIGAGHIRNAGHDYQPDYEMIALAQPQVLFSDGENGSSQQTSGKIKALHIKIASSRDYFEQEPLARAEWIKFFAAFIDKEAAADSIFERVKIGYGYTKNNVIETAERPTVFCNLPYNGIWYMPCGKNYVAKLITDAGGDFIWQKDDPINGLNLTLNFEQVYQRAAGADYWINPGVTISLHQIIEQDAKFKLFRACKTGKVYNCTNRLSAGGGMDMWETGTFRPDIVLSDLASIFHSSSPPKGLYYYQQLK